MYEQRETLWRDNHSMMDALLTNSQSHTTTRVTALITLLPLHSHSRT